MQPWTDPHSAADGILDDETYDWIADVRVMVESGGSPIVAGEADILRANEVATAAGYPVSHTGSAGLAGALAAPSDIPDGDRIAVVMSGVARCTDGRIHRRRVRRARHRGLVVERHRCDASDRLGAAAGAGTRTSPISSRMRPTVSS